MFILHHRLERERERERERGRERERESEAKIDSLIDRETQIQAKK